MTRKKMSEDNQKKNGKETSKNSSEKESGSTQNSEPTLRIPAILMPSYHKLMSSDESRKAAKRVRVLCGICEEKRYYSIHRGVTRLASVILACEACRHCYQKFKRNPCMLNCAKDGSCYVLGDNSKQRCKACWIAHILRRCPVSEDLYGLLVQHLPESIKTKMPITPPVPETVPEEHRGSLGLEFMNKGEWEDATIIVPAEAPAEETGADTQDLNPDCDTDESLGYYPVTTADGLQEQTESVEDGRQATQMDQNAMTWWMPGGGSQGYTITDTATQQTYFNMDSTNISGGLATLQPMKAVGNMAPLTTVSSSPGLTQLTADSQSFYSSTSLSNLTAMTPVQMADGLAPLMPLVPVQYQNQYPNGIQNSQLSPQSIKEEKYDVHDGESQEARLFQNIRVKEEYIPRHNQDLHVNSYFSNSPVANDIVNLLNPDDNAVNGNIKIEQSDWDSNDKGPPVPVTPETKKKPRKRVRKPKVKVEEDNSLSGSDTTKRSAPEIGPDGQPLPSPEKQRKKVDRFNGMPEEEVAKKLLPDHLAPNLDIIIIGINPGLFAAHVGHHYAGPGNHFWKCMFLSGLIPEPFGAYEDFRMIEYGIGFTNIVARTTRGSADLTKQEIKDGGEILRSKLQQYKPRIAVFNGKGIYEIYSGKKNFCFGKQPEKIPGTETYIWVMPSSSARCAQLPRALDKVPFYNALRRFRDYLNGIEPDLDEAEVVFTDVRLTNVPKSPVKKEAKIEPSEVKNESKSPQKKNKNTSKKTKGQKSSPAKGSTPKIKLESPS